MDKLGRDARTAIDKLAWDAYNAVLRQPGGKQTLEAPLPGWAVPLMHGREGAVSFVAGLVASAGYASFA